MAKDFSQNHINKLIADEKIINRINMNSSSSYKGNIES